MSMGYSANMALTISMEDMKRLNLPSFTALDTFIESTDAAWDSLAKLFIWDDPVEEITVEEQEVLENLYKAFRAEFKKETGITIRVGIHNAEDEGSNYDDVDGAFLYLDFFDVFHYTPEAGELRKKVKINFSNYVSFG